MVVDFAFELIEQLQILLLNFCGHFLLVQLVEIKVVVVIVGQLDDRGLSFLLQNEGWAVFASQSVPHSDGGPRELLLVLVAQLATRQNQLLVQICVLLLNLC